MELLRPSFAESSVSELIAECIGNDAGGRWMAGDPSLALRMTTPEHSG